MSIELIAGILLAIKIIVFAVVILPMRKKLRFFKKNYFLKSHRLTAVYEKIDTATIEEMYTGIKDYFQNAKDAENDEHYHALKSTFQAVVSRNIMLHLENCRKYDDVLYAWEAIKLLTVTVRYYREPYIVREINYRLTLHIKSSIEQFAKTHEPMQVFNGLQKIKKEVHNLLDTVGIETVEFVKKLEREYLEKLAGSLMINTELSLREAVVIADFVSNVSRDDHGETIGRIQNIIAPVIKKNMEQTVLEKYPWIKDKE